MPAASSLGRQAASDLRATAGWAGFNYSSGLPRGELKDVLMRCAVNNIRVIMKGPQVLDLYDEVDQVVRLCGQRWVIAHHGGWQDRARDLELVPMR